MVVTPAVYPRTPYLEAPAARSSAWVVPDPGSWFRRRVVVEEKLDGANVTLWLDRDRRPRGVGRSGPTGRDRAGQFGRLRAWVAEHDLQVRRLLGTDRLVFGEWLWLTHSVPYDRLPGLLVVLDVTSGERWCPLPKRDEVAKAASLPVPPRLFEGVLGNRAALEALVTTSQYGSSLAEGVILRDTQTGERCKWVSPTFVQADDSSWALGHGVNRLDTH